MFKYLSPLLLVLSLVSCGKNGGQALEVSGPASVIIGEKDWVPVEYFAGKREYKSIYENSKAVALIMLGSGGRCTGFMISDDFIMTNHHCISEKEDALGTVAIFNYTEYKMSETDDSTPIAINCNQFVMNDQELDFAILKCEGSPGANPKIGKVTLHGRSLKRQPENSVYVVHQNCDYFETGREGCAPYKKISLGQSRFIEGQEYEDGKGEVIYKEPDFVAHVADTLGGSSGSPVFSLENNMVISLHNSGVDNDGVEDGRGDFNSSVPMYKILSYIKKTNKSVYYQLNRSFAKFSSEE